jgi:hypothetical protein
MQRDKCLHPGRVHERQFAEIKVELATLPVKGAANGIFTNALASHGCSSVGCRDAHNAGSALGSTAG